VKLLEFFRYEVEYRRRGVTTWIYGAFFLAVAFAMIVIAADPGNATHINAPFRLATLASVLGMLGMLVSAAFFGDAAIRDHETRMDPLLFASPIAKIDYLGGRFLGALAVNAVILLAIPVGQMIATLMPFVPRQALSPFSPAAFAQTYLIILLPNLIVSGAILFTVATLTRQTIPVYVAALGMFVGYIVALNLVTGDAALMTDPFGVRVLSTVTERWTPVERNTRLLGSSGLLVLNRALWIAIAAGVLAILHWRFRFGHAGVADRTTGAEGARGRASAPTTSAFPRPPVRATGTFGFRNAIRQTAAMARRATADIVTSPVFLLIFAAKVGMTMAFGWEAGEGVFDTSTTPLTILVIERLADTPLLPITYLLVAVFAGELIWMDRQHEMADIVDAAPVSDGATVVSRFVALVAVLALLQLPVMVGGMIAQAFQGYTHFEVGLYLRILFGIQLADLMLLSALAVLVHVVVNQKYAGHIVVVVLLIARVAVHGLGWLDHHLLIYGTDPGWKYSEMNGFGPFVAAFVWFKAYWAAWAAMLLVGAVLLFVRGRDTSLPGRLRLARLRFVGPVVRAAAVAALLIVGLGGFVFYNTNVLNEYRTGDDRFTPQAMYEKRYRRYLDVPQPTIVAASLRAEIQPDAVAAELRGSYRLVNRTSVPIDSVHVIIDREMEVKSAALDRPSQTTLDDRTTGYRIVSLDHALAPGDSVTLTFDIALRRRGFRNSAQPTEIVSNGTWITRQYLPFIGYQPVLELDNKGARMRLGLGAQAAAPAARAPGAAVDRRFIRGDADRVQIDAIVGTSGDQLPLTPGLVVRSWTENGRRYVQYRTSPGNDIGGGFFSARYAAREDRWNNVRLRVLHDSSEGENVDRMMHGMKESLAYYTAHFGPYPDSLLQVLEIPRYDKFGVALPVSMAFSEDAFHSRVRDGEIDQPFYGAAHETAHQWWGGMARPAPVKGHGLLSESLANYSAMMVMEKTFGREVALRVYHFQMDRYFRMRGEVSFEVPLVDAEDQAYLTYRKGAVALYLLRDQIGEEAINTALRRYVAKFAHDGPPYPTSLDLLAELRAVTPDSVKSLITDLFETITLWEVRADRATVEQMPDGRFQVTLDVHARKFRSDNVGHQTEIPMNDLVEIGVFGKGKSGLGEPLYLERQRIHSGKQTIRVIVASEPGRAGIDPYDKVIDRTRGDNMRDLERVEPKR
jgi:ABC-type transport system involved in multi-copper enzyme maturation permease subunit